MKKNFLLSLVLASVLFLPSMARAQVYGCKAVNGVYACGITQDVTGCNGSAVVIDSSKCGCTDAQISKGIKGATACAKDATASAAAGVTPANDKLYNPLPTDSLVSMILYIGKGFLAGTGMVAVVFIIISGFRMILAQGNEEAYATAKRSVTWAIVGLVVALLAFSIVSVVQNIIGATIKTESINNIK